MLIAAWITGVSTAVLALSSLVAVITWRENRRREREDQMTAKILEAARKEFSSKDEVGGLKNTLTGWGALALIAGLIVWIAKNE